MEQQREAPEHRACRERTPWEHVKLIQITQARLDEKTARSGDGKTATGLAGVR
jgi:hypothetical protein